MDFSPILPPLPPPSRTASSAPPISGACHTWLMLLPGPILLLTRYSRHPHVGLGESLTSHTPSNYLQPSICGFSGCKVLSGGFSAIAVQKR
ncbi:unnamed protein product [Acanthoscelides obtectus]|uniref:Uncharacterized protein n=1 Tax=Acanthoscelides obtectus TaxID=200917 RepID=A0A9P0P0C0_ACAOB|nr:unnamed protein product [Acanthoscelides obtectus]CAK1648915.1 hypothetical protein AOBTE_LOCUS15959 [Acanthoscelides obtectus]